MVRAALLACRNSLSQSHATFDALAQKCRRREVGLLWETLVQRLKRREDLLKTDLLRIVHRATSVSGVAIPHDPHDVNVSGSQCDAILQHLGALVDERVHHALEDLLLLDLPRHHPLLSAVFGDQFVCLGMRDSHAWVLRLVLVPARPGLLSVEARARQHIEQPWVSSLELVSAQLLPHQVANVVAGEVTHLKVAHRHAELFQHPVHDGGGGALLD
mmetsp:Transcript_17447/g.31834  ORF Transcript_17447/g.31834 Transcript_17447/m.31834 type:complete len:216 (+) Transcript_17447:108-755(+)